MRWCPNPIRMVPMTMAPEAGGAKGAVGPAFPFCAVTRSPSTKGESCGTVRRQGEATR